MALPFTLVLEGLPASLSATNLLGFVYMVTLGAVLSYALWFRGIDKLPALAVSFLALGSPIVATLLGFLIKDQTFSFLQMIGVLAIISAVVLAQPRSAEPDASTTGEKKWQQPMSTRTRR